MNRSLSEIQFSREADGEFSYLMAFECTHWTMEGGKSGDVVMGWFKPKDVKDVDPPEGWRRSWFIEGMYRDAFNQIESTGIAKGRTVAT